MTAIDNEVKAYRQAKQPIEPEPANMIGIGFMPQPEVQMGKTYAANLTLLKTQFSRPEIQQCYYVTGETDFMLVLLVPSMSRFQALCDKLFHSNPSVKWFRTIVVLDRVKSTL